jgi:hypothetical protein
MNDAPDYPTIEWARTVCKIGHDAETCRYLTMHPEGWSCEKHSPLGRELDRRVAEKTIRARGDNCPGKDSR